MNTFSIDRSFKNPWVWGRILLSTQLAALFFSPALANLSEFLLILLFLFFAPVRSDFCKFFGTALGKYYLLFLISLLLGVGVAIVRETVDYGALLSWRKLLLFPFAAVLFRGQEKLKNYFLVSFLIVSILFSLASVAFWISGDLRAIVRNSSTQSVFFAAAIISGFYLAKYTSGTYSRALGWVGLFITLGGLLMVTQGRSGYLSLLIMTVIASVLLSRSKSFSKRLLFGITLAALAGVLMVLSPVTNQRIDQAVNEFKAPLLRGENTSMGQRKIFWVNSLKMIPDFWLFGAGTTGFGKAYEAAVSDQTGPMAMPTNDPHNQFLRIFLEQGILGLLVFLSFLAAAFRTGLASESGKLGVCVLVGWCATSVFSAHFTTFAEGRFIWIWLGVFIGSLAFNVSPRR